MQSRTLLLAVVLVMTTSLAAHADRQSDLKTFGEYANAIHRQLTELGRLELLDTPRANDKAFREAYRDGKFSQALGLVKANIEQLDRVSQLVVKRAEAFLQQADQFKAQNRQAEAEGALKQARIGRELALKILLMRDEHRILAGFTGKFLGDAREARQHFSYPYTPPGGNVFATEYQRMKGIATQQVSELRR